jgi:hypothetical protein
MVIQWSLGILFITLLFLSQHTHAAETPVNLKDSINPQGKLLKELEAKWATDVRRISHQHVLYMLTVIIVGVFWRVYICALETYQMPHCP